MNEPQNEIDKAFARNQYALLMFLVRLILMACIGAFLYGLFGHHVDFSIKKFFTPTTFPEERQVSKSNRPPIASDERIEAGIHVQTGLVYAEGFDIVRGTCTACHSAKLVTQNRATREGWKEMIRWMQRTQKLWDLGDNEPIILDYLAKHYAPEEKGRRENLDVKAIEWYVLDLSQQ